MLKRLLNCPERITYYRLSELCARRSAQVYAKVRLADVLPIEGSGLPDALYEFALQAHYDFVITDLAQKPLFAVEFDGPRHGYSTQLDRDTKKDELSSYFKLPLVRVIANDLHRSELHLDRLTEVTERWFDGLELASGDRFVVGGGPVVGISCVRSSDVAERPSCPLCGSGMVVKDGKYGPFLSCARFPECRGSCDLPGPPVQSLRQADGGRIPSSAPDTHRWLVAGVVLIGFALLALAVINSRSGADRSDFNEPALNSSGEEQATVRQMNLLGLLISRRGWDIAERDVEMERILGYNRSYSDLSKQEASKLITAWDDREP